MSLVIFMARNGPWFHSLGLICQCNAWYSNLSFVKVAFADQKEWYQVKILNFYYIILIYCLLKSILRSVGLLCSNEMTTCLCTLCGSLLWFLRTMERFFEYWEIVSLLDLGVLLFSDVLEWTTGLETRKILSLIMSIALLWWYLLQYFVFCLLLCNSCVVFLLLFFLFLYNGLIRWKEDGLNA